jgi:hypothetical protein
MVDPAIVFVVAVFVVLGLASLFISAAVLQAGSARSSAERPSFGRALGLVVFVMVLGTAANLIARALLGAPPGQQVDVQERLALAAITLVLNMFVAAFCYSRFVDGLAFRHGAMIYCAQIVITFILFFFGFMLVPFIGFAMGR